MKLVYVKMKNGEDIIGCLEQLTEAGVEITAPISMNIDPTYGIFAKSWLMFSELNTVWIRKEEYMFCTACSKKASDYYEEFMHNMAEKEQRKKLAEDTDFTSELEEIFGAMMDSKGSTKH